MLIIAYAHYISQFSGLCYQPSAATYKLTFAVIDKTYLCLHTSSAYLDGYLDNAAKAAALCSTCRRVVTR